MSNGGRRKTSGKKHSQSSAKWLQRQAKDPYAERARKEGRPSRAYYKLEQIDEMIQRQGSSDSRHGQRRRRGDGGSGLFRKGDIAIDLGAAPGGWSVYASKKIGPSGKLVAVDLLPLNQKTMRSLENDESMADFYFARADFNSFMTKEFISEAISGSDNELQCQADVIMSDMAANFTGNKSTDALRTLALCENALQFAAGTSCFDPPASLASKPQKHDEESSPKSWKDIGLLRVGGSFLCKYFQCGKENERMLLDTAENRFEDVRVLKPMASRNESAERYLLARGLKG